MAKPQVASLVTCQKLMVILARFLPGSITNDLSEPYGNLARFWSNHHGQILRGSITSDLSERCGNLGRILVRSPWPNLAW